MFLHTLDGSYTLYFFHPCCSTLLQLKTMGRGYKRLIAVFQVQVNNKYSEESI